MKIRIRGNTLRLRLTQSEVALLGQEGKVQEEMNFSRKTHPFVYELITTSDPTLSAGLAKNKMTIKLPSVMADKWVSSEEVGIESVQDNGRPGGLFILIEKDFACLTMRDGEDESDNFPNPNTTC
jgi:hypothetical protein